MIKQNDFNLYKIPKKNSRLNKLTQLIRKKLGEIFLSQDFRDDKGNNLMIFIDDVVLSKDGRTATVYLSNFVKINHLSDEDALSCINYNLTRIKKDFSEQVGLRYTPKLKFVFDRSRKKSFEIDELIGDLSPRNSKKFSKK